MSDRDSRRSEALEAELAALEAILPAGSPTGAPRPGVATGDADDQAVAPPPSSGPAPADTGNDTAS